MANEKDLRRAIIALAKADDGAGGLVPLTGKETPIVRAGSTGTLLPPIISLRFVVSTPLRPTNDPLMVLADFDIEVPEGAGGIEADIADRLPKVLTTTALRTQGLDVAPYWGRRRDLGELAAEGNQRLLVECRFKFNR